MRPAVGPSRSAGSVLTRRDIVPSVCSLPTTATVCSASGGCACGFSASSGWPCAGRPCTGFTENLPVR